MIEFMEFMGKMVVTTDKNIIDLKRNWVKSLYSEFEIGKPLNSVQYFQMMILYGEFLAEQIYQLAQNSFNKKDIKNKYLKLSDNLGIWMDRYMLYAIQCNENKKEIKMPKDGIELIEEACIKVMEFIPEKDYKEIINKFSKEYGVNLMIG
jgi:hypothetical protein